MKPDESRELASARTLLADFERDAASPDAHSRLSEALTLLADAVDEGGAQAQVAKNLGAVYAAKVAAWTEAMLERAGESSLAEMRHWRELLEEFGRCGMPAAPVAAALAELSKRFATRYVAQLSKTEKQFMLKQLEESKGRRKR